MGLKLVVLAFWLLADLFRTAILLGSLWLQPVLAITYTMLCSLGFDVHKNVYLWIVSYMHLKALVPVVGPYLSYAPWWLHLALFLFLSAVKFEESWVRVTASAIGTLYHLHVRDSLQLWLTWTGLLQTFPCPASLGTLFLQSEVYPNLTRKGLWKFAALNTFCCCLPLLVQWMSQGRLRTRIRWADR